MKISDFLNRSLSLTMTSSNESDEYKEFAVAIFNILLGESFAYNNQIRENKGKEKLDSVPVVESLDEESPYEEELNTAFIYGMAAKLLVADSNLKLGPVYQARYEDELQSKTPATYEPVEDIW